MSCPLHRDDILLRNDTSSTNTKSDLAQAASCLRASEQLEAAARLHLQACGLLSAAENGDSSSDVSSPATATTTEAEAEAARAVAQRLLWPGHSLTANENPNKRNTYRWLWLWAIQSILTKGRIRKCHVDLLQS